MSPSPEARSVRLLTDRADFERALVSQTLCEVVVSPPGELRRTLSGIRVVEVEGGGATVRDGTGRDERIEFTDLRGPAKKRRWPSTIRWILDLLSLFR